MSTRLSIVIGACLAASFFSRPCVAENAVRVVDDFSDASRWTVVASDGVELKSSVVSAPNDQRKSTLRLDVHFVSGAGFAGIRRDLPLDLPANFELAFSLRGDLPRNNLEFKIIDETGENVWWVNRRAFGFPHDWTRLAARRRHFQFAWGPNNAPIKRAKAIEIVVASAKGGRGTIYLDDLTFRPLPETQSYTGTPTLSASSEAEPTTPAKSAMDANADTKWQAAPDDRSPKLTVDFGVVREFGGMIIDWDPKAYAERYEIQFSDDGESWNTARTVTAASGRPQFISLPDSEARAVRLVDAESKKSDPVAIREIEVLPLEATRDPNEFAAVVAKRAPRGYYPRATLKEGIFWTVVGSPHDDREALISEDGAIEVDTQSFSIEPFLFVDGRLLTWADAKATPSLAQGHAPVPTVIRAHDGLSLSVTAAADGHGSDCSLWMLYELRNTSGKPIEGDLFLAVRPFQVNPPYQWLNAAGGVARVDSIALDPSRRIVKVNDRTVALGELPASFGGAEFDEGDVSSYISQGQTPPHSSVTDLQHAASAAFRYHFNLEPAQSRGWAVCVPFSPDEKHQALVAKPLLAAANPVEYVRRRQQAVVDNWIAATSTFDLLVPPEAEDIMNTMRSTLAYILVNRDGAGIQPGSRSYERSWIRDGSLTAAALLRFGLNREAREFVDWYAPYQFESGKVPCVVDRRGPDPVPENDSHGQYIMAVMNVYRFGHDKAYLEQHWPRVEKAVAYIEKRRAQRMTREFADPNTTITRQEPGKPAVNQRAFNGLMPESISHEGYSAKPMHSYWDDFFTLRGLKDAAEMARIVGDEADARRYQTLADDFADTLYASIKLAMKTHDIDYIPGCVELGDFDATSTTVALWPCGELHRLPRPALDRTFEKYWEQFVARRDDPSFAWTAYTPYELRTIGSLVLLGQVERAHEAIDFFMDDRSPPGWNQWPEVVHRDPRTPQFIGDMPHTWCGSDFLNSIRMLFLYEREADDALVLLAGVPKPWISTQPVGFREMPTYGGRVSCTIERASDESDQLVAKIAGSFPVPSGGIRLASPLGPVKSATINGKPAKIDDDGFVIIRDLPARIEL